jgi:hypothetical protein
MTIFLGLIPRKSAICHLLLVMLGIRNQLLGCQGLKMTVPNISLSVEEKEWWKSTIQDFRKQLVKNPRHYIDASIAGKNFTATSLQANVETLLIDEREQIYNLFLEDDSVMNGKVVAHLIENIPVPKSIFNDLVDINVLVTWFAIIAALSQVIFLFNFFFSMFKGQRSSQNPWKSNTLEWTTPVEHIHGNWPGEIPEVHRWAYDYSKPDREEDFVSQITPLTEKEIAEGAH